MINPVCSNCGSDNLVETSKVDMTIINKNNCRHDFECVECGTIVIIEFAPIAVIASFTLEAEGLAKETNNA